MRLNCQIRHCKKVNCTLSTYSLHYQTVIIDQMLTNFHHLHSWTSVRLLKCPIDKIISLQGHLNSEQFPECNMTSSRASFKGNSFDMNQFSYQSLKINKSAFDKISLLFQTVLESEANSLSSTVQLDFSWALKMSDR